MCSALKMSAAEVCQGEQANYGVLLFSLLNYILQCPCVCCASNHVSPYNIENHDELMLHPCKGDK